MEHREVEQRDVVERYLQGKLPAAETRAFEQHLMDCPECFDRVRWESDFRQTLRAAAAEDVARAGLWTWLARRRAAWLLALVLAAGVPSALLVRERSRPGPEPRINTSIIYLDAARDAAASPPVVLSPGGGDWVVLSLSLPRLEHESYLATLETAQRDQVWRREGLVADNNDAFVILLPAAFLAPGDYVLRLDAAGGSASQPPAGEFPFRVER